MLSFLCFTSQGTFVLQDNHFRWSSRMSIESSPEMMVSSQNSEDKASQAMSMHLYFPCGIIRGALLNLGIPCAVSADISHLPACKQPSLRFVSPSFHVFSFVQRSQINLYE